MQYIPGDNLRCIMLRGGAAVCDTHKGAVHEAVQIFLVEIATFGVHLLDLYPRNVMLPPLKERREYCASPKRSLRLADWKNLELVMIDFGAVKFMKPL